MSMKAFSITSLRVRFGKLRNNGAENSPAIAWYTIMTLFILSSLAAAFVAYDRFTWANEEVSIEVRPDQPMTVTKEDIDEVVSVYEQRRLEHVRLKKGGPLETPMLTLGQGVTLPAAPAAGSESSSGASSQHPIEFY